MRELSIKKQQDDDFGEIHIRDNPCPKCDKGEIVCYTKPDENHFVCNECGYEVRLYKKFMKNEY